MRPFFILDQIQQFLIQLTLNQIGIWFGAVESPNPSAHYVVIHKISDILCRNSVSPMVIGWGACGEYVKVTGIITDLIFEHPDRMDFHCGVFI